MILRIVKETIGPSMPKNGRPNERMDEWMKRESNNTCSPIFFPPQICHGRRIRFINACCKNCCASLPPQGGGHGECASFSPTFGYFNWPRVSEQISQDAVSVWFTSFCERRAKRGRKKSARFVSPLVSGSWYRSLKWRDFCADTRTIALTAR